MHRGYYMELLNWTAVNRKRSNGIPYWREDYVLGYDLDMEDFAALTKTFNERALTHSEESRLHNHVLTMLNIVLENPKLTYTKQEVPELADAMYMDGWGALRYIKDGRRPYSYVYRSMFTAACRYFKRKIASRAREEAIAEHINEVYEEFMDSISDHKVRGQ